MNCVGTPNKSLGNLMKVLDIFHLKEEGKNGVGREEVIFNIFTLAD